MTTDKRAYHRIFYNAESQLSCDDKSWPCRIVDLSLQGCLLRFEAPWKEDPEKIYTLELTLSDEVKITMALSVCHVVDNTAGFKCDHIDIESITALRRLVELNLGDSRLLERDLLALAEGN
ncbi:MAG: PilZ domain-containing protein [Gammaproteobacteria bacterium]